MVPKAKYLFGFCCVLAAAATFALLAPGCGGPDKPPVPHVDISSEKDSIRFTWSRFDRDLFSTDFSQPSAARQQLYQQYGHFLCDFTEAILQVGPCDSARTFADLQGFATFPDILELQGAVQEVHSDETIEAYNKEFQEALIRWHHFFPDSVVPGIVYMNSGLNFSAYSADDYIAVGLDFFLGQDHRITRKLAPESFPVYIREDMRRDYLVPNAVRDFLYTQTAQNPNSLRQTNFLHQMIYHGKVMYMLDALLPETPDSTKINWSSAQMEWASENEWNVWKEVATQKVMYMNEPTKIRRWFDYGPFTNAGNLPQESAPQLGIWMGWQIVRAYMRQHPEITPEQLLNEPDAARILSAYKPDLP